MSAKCQDVKCQDHVSWSRPEGVLLVGGTQQSDLEPETTELVSWDGSSSEEKFNLSVTQRSVLSPQTWSDTFRANRNEKIENNLLYIVS